MKSVYRAAFGGCAVAVLCILLRIPSSVEAATATQADPLPERFFALLSVPFPVHAAMQENDAKKKDPDAALPEGKGRDLAKKLCSTCHANNTWSTQRHTADKWGEIIDEMVSRGLEASDADIQTVTGYLATNFGPKDSTPPAAANPPAQQ